MTEQIRNGRDLFRTTDDQFRYWYADAYGIQPSFAPPAYEDLSLTEARELRDELTELIEFCEQYEEDFADL